jgi:hypothetical protein
VLLTEVPLVGTPVDIEVGGLRAVIDDGTAYHPGETVNRVMTVHLGSVHAESAGASAEDYLEQATFDIRHQCAGPRGQVNRTPANRRIRC